MSLTIRFCWFFLLLTFLNVDHLSAQRNNPTYEKYIKQYGDLAIFQQRKYGIPASITLAQGILESGAGQGDLAKRSNNHFGIKCNNWKGAKVYHNDDKQGECFRKYKKVEDSYEDHSLFLTQRPWYEPLFKLKITDYKGWAKGLQKSGYATDPSYGKKLIKLIEDYDLHQYDKVKSSKQIKGKKGRLDTSGNKASDKTNVDQIEIRRNVYKTYGLIYVYADANDSFEQIARDIRQSAKELAKFNDLSVDQRLIKGEVIYLQKKKKKADKPHYDHVVLSGETMHHVAQKYGIQLNSLLKMNKKKKDYRPVPGEVLKLR
ncbi:glucosaminidase domain-containing protein [Parabacteroides sp. PF5-9]|uniref:glucosaminidase domain-containing protein n=1 Tax=Parabacteroides sp. PF5-9 TaxID=1742404 RepID=UPI0024744266|nr:glucosaminidase domain-containing protein [Parabacteroides sp. PF5-9]MDH6358164.1 LysM repeat protein [Parabacteroides sp. PF5-9]